jgi:hypothetical protein
LVTNYVFKQYSGVDVVVMEPGELGGDFLKGGLKYIHRTDEMVALMGDLKLVFSNYSIRGGILLKGDVQPYPKALEEMPRDQARRIQFDHYRKTRRQEPTAFAERSMNDPENVAAKRAIRCDFGAFIQGLAGQAKVVRGRLARIEPERVITMNGNSHDYDYLVLTIPLWVIRQVSYFPLPEAHAMSLNLIRLKPRGDPFAKWDYVYTPYTPADAIHRVSHNGEGVYTCEMNGVYDPIASGSDLNFIFKDGYEPLHCINGLNGHLLPLTERPEYPDNVVALGRFAKWDPRSTLDVVLDDARACAEGWGWSLV